jgi:hypothetical protein
MTREQASEVLECALRLSEQIAALADGGEVSEAVRLDVERRQLLESAHGALHPLDEHSRSMLRDITALNDRSVGLMEHRLRAKVRDMDMASVGRRAVAAYGEAAHAGVGMQR